MIDGISHDAAALEQFRTDYGRATPPHVVVSDALTGNAARALRTAAAPGLEAFYVANRGRYHVNNTFAHPELFERLRGLAEGITERRLRVGPARWMRFRHGDYQLMQGDGTDTPQRGQYIEITVDFSEHEAPDADFAYVNGTAKLSLPQLPLSTVLVERAPGMLRYDSYLKNQVGVAEVWRLRLALLLSA